METLATISQPQPNFGFGQDSNPSSRHVSEDALQMLILHGVLEPADEYFRSKTVSPEPFPYGQKPPSITHGTQAHSIKYWPNNIEIHEISDDDDADDDDVDDVDDVDDDTGQSGSDTLSDSNVFSAVPPALDEDDDLEIIEIVRLADFKRTARNGVKFTCAPGKCVELDNGEFIRILKIVIDKNMEEWMVGNLYMRHNDLKDTKWPRRHNEAVLVSRVKQDRQQFTVKRSLGQVVRNRNLILTNCSWPLMSSHDHPDTIRAIELDKQIGPLFCRWKHVHVLDETEQSITEESIERLLFEEVDSKMDNEDVRLIWRQRATVAGGDCTRYEASVESNGHSYTEVQRYAFVDAFCGGGGATCAAYLAGLAPVAGIDSNEKAIRTYRANFGSKGTSCYLEDISEFIARCERKPTVVDVLHISPPCQTFSPAHTVPNLLMDDSNSAAIFAVEELLRVLKPRVVTLEETFGLKNRHEAWFNALIKMFLDKGYSVRWKIAKLEEYGLPQKRRRLLIIGAGPGEVLPPFPVITHSEKDSSLKPLNTIQVTYAPGQQKPPYSALTQAKTITTSGGIGNHHPNGLRNFTIREFAALQMFPLTYKFPKIGVTALRRQIGNAVPPYIFKKIYREIIESLKKTDGIL